MSHLFVEENMNSRREASGHIVSLTLRVSITLTLTDAALAC
jgi:hypothetical protein